VRKEGKEKAAVPIPFIREYCLLGGSACFVMIAKRPRGWGVRVVRLVGGG